VTVVPQPSYDDVVVDERDLKFEFMRSSGPGGQSVNKTDSAVRVTHLPTGFVTECQEERSQLRNRSKAIFKIKDMIFKKKFEDEMDRASTSRKTQVRSLNRNEKIRTYNFSRHMITDHRLGVSKQVPNLAEFLEGVGDFEVMKLFHKQLLQSHEMEQLANILESEKVK
jgi:peptide chain release factor 1